MRYDGKGPFIEENKMQPKFDSHKIVQIRAEQEYIKVNVRDYQGNEIIKDLRQYSGRSGKIRNQVVGPSVEWKSTQWFYDIEIDNGSRIHRIPEGNLEEVVLPR
jgi:hypothetical protein